MGKEFEDLVNSKAEDIVGGHLGHHGVKGQRWGVRRYQNEDGSLKDPTSKSYKEKATDLDDDELQRRIKRLQLEEQYERLRPKTKAEKRHDTMHKLFKDSATIALAEVMKMTYKAAATLIMSKVFPGLELDKKKGNKGNKDKKNS